MVAVACTQLTAMSSEYDKRITHAMHAGIAMPLALSIALVAH